MDSSVTERLALKYSTFQSRALQRISSTSIFPKTLTSFHYVHSARAVYHDRLLSVPWFTKCLWKGTSQLIPPTHRRISELVKRIGISMLSQFNRLNVHKRFFFCHGLSSTLVHRTSNRSPHTGLQYTAKTVGWQFVLFLARVRPKVFDPIIELHVSRQLLPTELDVGCATTVF